MSQRLISNAEAFLGINREQAALNAANNTGNHPTVVTRYPSWPSLKKFNNDNSLESFSPFGGISNPEYIWDESTSNGQTVALAIASDTMQVPPNELHSFSAFLIAIADNAMEAKIELFEQIEGSFVKVSPQPDGLDEFLLVAGAPNTPAVGLTETQPYNWQDIRVYSTQFAAPQALVSTRSFKIVVSFEVTNYLISNTLQPNPAGLQFMVDIYSAID